jgi:hypothetical protein
MRAETADRVEFKRSAVLLKLPKRAIQTKVSRNLRFTGIGPGSTSSKSNLYMRHKAGQDFHPTGVTFPHCAAAIDVRPWPFDLTGSLRGKESTSLAQVNPD